MCIFLVCSLSWVSIHHTLHAVTSPGVGDEVMLVSDKVMLDDDACSATPAVWSPAACSVRPLTPTPTKPPSPLSSKAQGGLDDITPNWKKIGCSITPSWFCNIFENFKNRTGGWTTSLIPRVKYYVLLENSITLSVKLMVFNSSVLLSSGTKLSLLFIWEGRLCLDVASSQLVLIFFLSSVWQYANITAVILWNRYLSTLNSQTCCSV